MSIDNRRGMDLYHKLIDIAFIATTGVAAACTLGGSIDAYAQQVKKDNEDRSARFSEAGTTDLSGKGYSACNVSSDCLSGEQSCIAGTTPNTLQMPGYCVEDPTD